MLLFRARHNGGPLRRALDNSNRIIIIIIITIIGIVYVCIYVYVCVYIYIYIYICQTLSVPLSHARVAPLALGSYRAARKYWYTGTRHMVPMTARAMVVCSPLT